jgi:hypothetical protein
MGEIAEMMLEGFLDEETGAVIDGSAPGYPRRMADLVREKRPKRDRVVPCPTCRRLFVTDWARDHHRSARAH